MPTTLSGLLPRFSFYAVLVMYAVFVAPFFAVAQPFGLTQRVTVSGLNFPLDDPAVTGGTGNAIELVRAFPSLSFSQPVFVISPRDGTNRLFVVEKTGRIRVFQNSDATASSTIFLDITSKVNAEGEQGLLGLAFDPDFSSNGNFYIYYNASSGARRSVIARYHVNSSTPNTADPNSESIVIQVTQPPNYSNHKGGTIAFGPDGMLYIGMGDGGSGGDPENHAQNCADMLGAMLRINPRSGSPYSIPAGNPFSGGGPYNCGILSNAGTQLCGQGGSSSSSICREIYAYGIRNPWKFSFDRVSGTMWIGDVGQGAWEEVNTNIVPGANLGWRFFEGTHTYNNPNNLPLSNFLSPIAEYPHNSSGGYSITGGYVYRGAAIPELYGKYVYGDYVSGRIWALLYNGSTVVSNQALTGVSLSNLSSFGEDEAGELYAVNLGAGTLHRFRRGSGASGPVIPPQLSQTGLFQNLATLTPNPGIIEFDVNAPLWSDYALKKRWIALPGTSTMQFNSTEAFTFPVGTAIIKHFGLQLSAAQTKRLETRVLFRHNQGWTGYTYKWNAAQSDADLLVGSASETIQITDPTVPGGARAQEWYYPSRADCMSCHTPGSGIILGVRTRQLNRNFNYSGVVDNQLRSWNNIGLFSTNIGAHTAYGAYAQYADNTASMAARARGYIASNCAHCHQPAVPSTVTMDLRYDTLDAAMNVLNVRPSEGNLGLNDAYRVKPNVKESSVFWERMRRLDGNRMPKIGSSLVDPEGVNIVGAWIDQVTGDSTPPAAPFGLTVQ